MIDLDRRRLHLGTCAVHVFWSLLPLFTETCPNIGIDPSLPYSQYSTTLQSSDATKPSSTNSGGPNMKIKQQLPSVIRSNSRQAGVTKAEQEKPLTANHCIDRQARPPPAHPTRLYPCPQTRMYTAVHQPLLCSTCTDTKRYFKVRLCGVMRSVATHSLLCYFSADSSVWILCFCPFALSKWQNEGKRDETRLISFGCLSSGGLRANIRIFTC